VLLLVDGVPVNQGDRGGINWDIVSPDQVRQVEILKGASSVLYGSAALGGVVNLITREIPPGLHFRVRATGGAYADPPHDVWRFRDRTGLQGGGDVTGSYGVGPFRGSLAAGARRSDGYREQDGREHWHVAGRGQWRFADPSELRVSGSLAVDDYAVPLSWCTRGSCDDHGQAYQPFRIDRSALGATTVSRKGYLSAAFSRIPSPRLRWQVRGSWLRTHFIDRRDSVDFSIGSRYGAELRAEVRTSDRQVVTVGFEGAQSDSRSNIFSGDTARRVRSRRQGEYAAYAESEQPLGWGRLAAGTRIAFLAVDGGSLSAVLSPRLGVVLPGRRGIWRASVGHGFRAPSLAERFVRTTAVGIEVIPNPGLDPETSWSIELGHARPFSERVRADGTAFWTEARRLIEPVIVYGVAVDPVTGDSVPVPRIQFQNVARARLAGLELLLSASPFARRFRTSVAYMFLHSRQPAGDTVPAGPLAFRPRHLLTASADYDLSPIGLGVDFRYMSRFERVELFPDDPRVPVQVLDLRLSYRSGPVEAHVLVANALNYVYNLAPRTLAPVRTATATLTWTY
jgi:outer membrane receptor protein involved in Fe transport